MHMSEQREQVPQPPQPPKFERKLKFYPYQLIGIPLLFLIPILALLGLFGETSTSIQSADSGIEINVHYPNRIHFQGLDGTEIAIRNTTENVIPLVTVSVEKAFLDAYSDVTFTPDVDRITEEVYMIDLTDIPSGETRYITIDSRGKIAGSHRGFVTASADDIGPSVTLETFIFP
jgi:hypothetical protein